MTATLDTVDGTTRRLRVVVIGSGLGGLREDLGAVASGYR
jgi:hypothetical protein